MKKIIAAIALLSVVFLLFGCNTENKKDKENDKMESSYSGTGHKIYVREPYSPDKMTAVFSSTTSDETETVTLQLEKKEEEYSTFSCAGDTKKYDRVRFTSDDTDKSMVLVFNDFINGYYLKAGSSQGSVGIPFVYDNEMKENAPYKTVSLKYDKTVNKNIFIWTPESYDKNDKTTKYSVIYMCDGQNMFDEPSTTYGSWNVAQSAESMMANSENKCIIVGIDDGDGNRDSELTPLIGELAEDRENMTMEDFENGTGEIFSDFVVNTVMPYIEKNYNVYTDNKHTSVCGSSSGGIEAFYMGMEHPDKFGAVGALSPAFLLYNEDVWIDYLNGCKFNGNEPFVYIYTGSGDQLETRINKSAKDMKKYLEKVNYPKDKYTLKEYKEASHNEHYWRNVFPEFLKFAFNVK